MRSWRRYAAGTAAAAVLVLPVLVGATNGGSGSRLLGATACGTTVTSSVTLSADLACGSGDGLDVGANGVVVNLNGHTISGSGSGLGVSDGGHGGVTVKGGIVSGFNWGVLLTGAGSKAQGLKLTGNTLGVIAHADKVVISGNVVVANSAVGITIGPGSSEQVTSNWVADNGSIGIEVDTADHAGVTRNSVIDNATHGIYAVASSGTIVGNVSNANGADGIWANAPGTGVQSPLTIGKNHASFNINLGMYATSGGALDGGGNVVQANGTAQQCQDLVCAQVGS